MLNTSTFTLGAVTLAATTGVMIETTLATRYSTERTFEVSVAVESSSETLSSEFYIDGEPMEGRGFGGGGSSTTMSYSYTDTAKEVKAGALTKVERSFDEVSASTEREGRDGPMELEAESSFEGLTILSKVEGGVLQSREAGFDRLSPNGLRILMGLFSKPPAAGFRSSGSGPSRLSVPPLRRARPLPR